MIFVRYFFQKVTNVGDSSMMKVPHNIAKAAVQRSLISLKKLLKLVST